MTTYPAPWITLGATGHGSCWGTTPAAGRQQRQQAGRHRLWAMLGRQHQHQAGRHGSGRAPWIRPGAMDQAGRHGPWAMLGHRQQQAGAVGHAGRHRPWAMLGHQQQASRPAGRAHRASGIGHGPCWAPAAAGRRHGSRRAPARAAPGGQHQHQAGTVDQAGYQLGQRLVNGTSSSRPARRAPVPGQHAGRQCQASTPGAIGHGPCWGTRPAPGRHQAGTVDQAGHQLGQRLVNSTNSRPGAIGHGPCSGTRPAP